MGLYNDYYLPQPTQISLVQIIMTAAIVFVFAIVPITVIAEQRYQADLDARVYTATALQERESESGQVAGASTASGNMVKVPLLNLYLDLSDETHLYSIAGASLIACSLILGGYLLFSSPRPKKHYHRELTY